MVVLVRVAVVPIAVECFPYAGNDCWSPAVGGRMEVVLLFSPMSGEAAAPGLIPSNGGLGPNERMISWGKVLKANRLSSKAFEQEISEVWVCVLFLQQAAEFVEVGSTLFDSDRARALEKVEGGFWSVATRAQLGRVL